jgi:sodium-dependent phosphate cotransporter
MLCGCLIGLVKLLNSLLGEKVKKVISEQVNRDLPSPYLAWLTPYLAILVGAGLTVLVQSSSVFTSTLTPLAGAGLVSLERVYPLTLGSNIGTTTTSLLAALASKGNERAALQIALVHLLFNITGILLFYPVPVLRLPVPMAKKLGEITSQYRWFSVLYLILMFFLLPAIIFSLSLAGTAALATVLIIVAVVTLMVVTLNICQKYTAKILPEKFRTWDFLPEPLHSLEPYDRIIVKLNCFKLCRKDIDLGTGTDAYNNKGFQQDIP